jgi:hypothetical protein
MGKPVDVDLKEYSTKPQTPTEDYDPTDHRVEKENKENQNG